MVIQRIQTVWLLVATALMAVFCFCIPIAEGAEGAKFYAMECTPALIIGILTLLLLVIDIFLFKNLKNQINVCLASAVLIFGTLLTAYTFMAFNLPAGLVACWVWPSVVAIAAIVFTVMAFSGMKKDRKILRDSERLW